MHVCGSGSFGHILTCNCDFQPCSCGLQRLCAYSTCPPTFQGCRRISHLQYPTSHLVAVAYIAAVQLSFVNACKLLMLARAVCSVAMFDVLELSLKSPPSAGRLRCCCIISARRAEVRHPPCSLFTKIQQKESIRPVSVRALKRRSDAREEEPP